MDRAFVNRKELQGQTLHHSLPTRPHWMGEDMFDRDDLLSSVAQPPLSGQNLDPDSINFWIKSSTVLLTRVRCQWQWIEGRIMANWVINSWTSDRTCYHNFWSFGTTNFVTWTRGSRFIQVPPPHWLTQLVLPVGEGASYFQELNLFVKVERISIEFNYRWHLMRYT